MLPIIDKNSYIPAYIQIRDHFLKLIENQELKPGDQIPPENEIVQSSGLSRMTVRQGIQQLVQQGYLKAQRGLGTFVTIPTFSVDTMSFSSLNKKKIFQNSKIVSTINILEERTAPVEVIKQLNLGTDDAVWYFERLRSVNSVPLVFEICYLPKNMFPKLSKKNLEKSKYEWIQNSSKNNITFTQRNFKAIMPDEKLIGIFKDIDQNQPLIQKNTISFFDNQVPFESSIVYYHPINYPLNETQIFKE